MVGHLTLKYNITLYILKCQQIQNTYVISYINSCIHRNGITSGQTYFEYESNWVKKHLLLNK